MEKINLENWNDFISGEFLGPANVNENDAFVVISVEGIIDEKRGNKKKVRLELERNGQEWTFDLNKTNTVFLKNNGIDNPKKLIGSKIYFKKVLVINPSTKLEVEGLRITKVEK